MNEKILVSACLLGMPVRYDGAGIVSIHPILQQWLNEDRLIVVCPELLAGMSIPRPAAEIRGPASGMGVLNGQAKVFDKSGKNVSDLYVLGAQKVIALVEKYNIKMAVMKARSPSCGSIQTYDGSFSSKLIKGQGVTSALLLKHGLKVFNEEHLEDAKKWLHDVC